MIENHENIDKKLMEINLTDLINGEVYNHDEILLLCDNVYKNSHGLAYFDVFVIKTFITKLSKSLNRKLNVLEIGCGTSSRVIKNLGHNIKTYALSDDHALPLTSLNINIQHYEYNVANVFENKKKLIEEFNECDLFFLDGDHSFEFAKFIYEEIVLNGNKKKPIICHDFLPFNHEHTYGEQVYLINEFLTNKNDYQLFTHTSQELEKINEINKKTGSKFIEYYNNYYQANSNPLPIACIAIIN